MDSTAIGFSQAVKALQEQRRLHLRVHCTLDELDAYHRGALPDDRRDDIAEHLAACENCSILLLYAVIEPGGNGGRADVPSAEIEEAWNRLRPHLGNGSNRGDPLTSLLANGPLPVEKALPLALEISRALAALHSGGRPLSDLRAENVLIDSSGRVYLPDLGLSLTPESLEAGYGRPAENALADLYRSLSPEQVAGEGFDHRSNLFSLGVVLYEVLTGTSPFRDSTPLGTASRILSLEPPPVIELNPGVGPAVSELIAGLLAKDPEDRPQTAAAVTCALEALMSKVDGSQLGPEGVEPLDLDAEIDRLYDEIIALTRQGPATSGSARDEEIERAYARLQELQAVEAKRFREWFEASLEMPIDAGESILARARALREELENLTSSDPAAPSTDEAQAPSEAR